MTTPLHQNLRAETVERLPLRDAILLAPDATAAEAAAQMRSQHLGCAIVVDAQGEPLGFFTERTLIELLLAGQSLDRAAVRDYLYPDWYAAHLTDPIATVATAVVDHGARFVCVLDAEDKPRALTGQRGLAEYVADHYPGHVMTQRIGAPAPLHEREGG